MFLQQSCCTLAANLHMVVINRVLHIYGVGPRLQDVEGYMAGSWSQVLGSLQALQVHHIHLC